MNIEKERKGLARLHGFAYSSHHVFCVVLGFLPVAHLLVPPLVETYGIPKTTWSPLFPSRNMRSLQVFPSVTKNPRKRAHGYKAPHDPRRL